MRTFLYTGIFLLLWSACSQKAVVMGVSNDTDIPACLQKTIDSIQNQPVWNPPAEIHEYQYMGKRVFLISADCCDQFSTVVDEECNYICAPYGGFTGKGDGKCTDFNQVAKHVKSVWKDERKK